MQNTVLWDDLNRAPVRPTRTLTAFNAARAVQRSQQQRERGQQAARSYAGADINRLTGDWTALATSADSELLTSLRVLRSRSRQLVRDNPYARHVVRVIVNNVIGNGIGLQGTVVNSRGVLQTAINDSIEGGWGDWCDRAICHTAGVLNFADIERMAMSELVVAGEAIIRKVRMPFGGGTIPLALEVIEAERLMDQWQTARAPNGNAIRMGVEVDTWGRPQAYWFHPHHPGDYQFATFQPSKFLRVPADEIIHLHIVDRWPMSRGEPWFHSVLRTMHDTAGLEEGLVVKARASANIVGFIRSPEPMAADGIDRGRQVIDTEPGTWQRLLPGEDVAGATTTVADPSVDPFLRYMVRKMAVGVGISYEAASRDYTNATYSSARMGLLDDRSMYRVLQGFIGRNLRMDVHREWCDGAVLVGAIKVGADYYSNPKKYQSMRLKPRGWSWIDPTKEVQAYQMAVRDGFMSVGDVINQTADGADLEDVWKARAREIELADELGLVFDTDPAQVSAKGQAQGSAIPAAGGEPANQQPGQAAEAEPEDSNETPSKESA